MEEPNPYIGRTGIRVKDTAGLIRSTRSPPTVSARTQLIGPHAYNFSTNQSDAYTFSTSQSQVYKNSTDQSQACRFSTVGFCWWPVVVTSPTDTACTQVTKRVWAGNPAFKTSKTRQEKKSLSRLTWSIMGFIGTHLLLINNADTCGLGLGLSPCMWNK